MGVESFYTYIVAVSIQFPIKKYIYAIARIYWVLNDTSNALSHRATNMFFVSEITLVDTLKYCDFNYQYRNKLSCF